MQRFVVWREIESPFAKEQSRGFLRALLSGLVALAALAAAPPAAAEESDFCRAVRARASADASLLMWPQIVAQALRFPDLASQSGFPLDSRQGQARAALTYSLIDLYKGLGVLSVAEAQCEAHHTQRDIEELLLSGEDLVRLPALRARVAFLASRLPGWKALVAREEEKFARRVITLIELTEIRLKAADLERRLARSEAELHHLESLGLKQPGASVDALSRRFLARADQAEQRASHVRALASWQVKLTGGGTFLSADRPDWYGLVELSFNLGAFNQSRYDARYLEARRDEMKSDRAGLIGRLLDLQTRLRGARSQAASELSAVDRHWSLVVEAKRSVGNAETASAAYAAALLMLEEISVEAERIYLRSIVAELSSFLEEPHG